MTIQAITPAPTSQPDDRDFQEGSAAAYHDAHTTPLHVLQARASWHIQYAPLWYAIGYHDAVTAISATARDLIWQATRP